MSEPDLRQRLAAILAADVTGYSRLMALDERATVAELDAAREVFRMQIEANQGRVIDMAGDSVLAVFETAAGAVSAGLAVQRALFERSSAAPEERRMRFRIGVHLGDVMVKDDGTVYGDGVNLAARLQALAEPGEVAVSEVVRMAVRGRVDAAFIDQGEKEVKNIPTPVRWCRAMPALPRSGATDPRTRTAAKLLTLPSIAILPFRAAGSDIEQASFADGLRAEIQNSLVKIAGLVLVGIATTNTYRDREVSPRQAAAEMGARYVLDGLVQKASEQVRIHVSLTEASSGQVVWSERYESVLNEAFETQDRITERVVTELDVKLMSGEEARVWRKALKHPRAREHFYRGMHEFMKGQRDANALARENFEQVARLVPETSMGATHVAFTHWMDAFRGWTPAAARSFDLAAQWAGRAIAMEDADGQAHTVMAHIHLLRREHDKALETAEQAVTLRPACMNANGHLGNILYYCGRPADAADRIRQVMRISPLHAPWIKLVLASSLKEIRQLDESAQVARDVLRAKSDDVDARLVLIEASIEAGDRAAAQQLASEIRALQPGFSVQDWATRQPYRDAEVLSRIVSRLRDADL